MNFSNKKVTRTYASPHSKNAWAYLHGIGWRKVGQLTTDGATNIFMMVNIARAHNMNVSGTINASNQISLLYL